MHCAMAKTITDNSDNFCDVLVLKKLSNQVFWNSMINDNV